MAFTKVVGAGIHTLSNIHSHNVNSSGIITATKFVGPFDGTSGDFSGNVTIDGNLVVNGDTTTLNTTLREVELLRVDANTSTIAGIITQRGSGDILKLYDDNTAVFSVAAGIVTSTSTLFAEDFSTSGIGTFADIHVKNPTDTRITSIAPGALILSRDTPVILFKNNLSDSFDASIDVVSNELRFKGGGNNATSTRMITTSSGVSFPQNIDVDGQTHLDDVSIAGVTTIANNKELVIGEQADNQYNTVIKQIPSGSTGSLSLTTRFPRIYAHDTRIMDIDGNGTHAYFWPNQIGLYASGNERLQITGSGIKVFGTSDGHGILLDNTTNRNNITAESNRPGAVNSILEIDGKWNNTQVAFMTLSTGDDTTNKDDGRIRFFTKPSGGTIAERLRIEPDGEVLLPAAGANRISMRHSGGGAAVIKNPTGANLSFGTNNNDAEFVVGNGGNIGIGSSAPVERLVVQGDLNSSLVFDKNGTGFDGTSGGTLALSSVFDYSGARLGLYVDNAGQGRIATKTAQALHFGQNNQKDMTIAGTSGYVGINTTSPDSYLEVFGGTNSIKVGNQSGSGQFGADGTSAKIGASTNHHLDLFTNGTSNTRVRITNSGKILTGGETSGEISDGGIHIKTSNNGGNTHALILENHGSSADTQVIMKFAPTTSTTNDRWNSINVVNVDGQNKFDTAFYTCPGGTPLEAMRIDNQQRLLIGYYQAVAKHQTNPNFQISGTTVDHASASLGIWGASANPARLEFSKSRHGTIGSHTAVAADDTLGEINFSGSDGTRYLGSAYIKATATTPIADYDVAGFLSFGTNYGTTSPTERVRITKDGYVHIGTASHLGTMRVGGQAITGQDQDPIIKVYTSSSNQWLAQLRSDHTTGNGVFLRAGNSSSTYTLYATGYDENNAHLVVRGDGKIGIGEKTPVAALTINKGSTGQNTTHTNGELLRLEGYDSTNSRHGIGFGRYNGGANGYKPAAFIGAATGTWSSYTNCHLVFSTRNSTGDDDPTERLRITNDGKVVAGNSGAGYSERLQAHGGGSTGGECLSLNSTGGNNIATELRFYENGTGRFRMKTQQGNPGIKFEDWTNGATRAEIAADGDFKIHSGTRSWATIHYRNNSRGLRRHYREFGTGASASTFNLIRVRRHYWGWGHYKFTIKRGYYSGIAEDVYYLNGHGRDDGSYNPSYSIGQRQYNGHGSNFGYSGRITITSPSGSSPGDAYANFVDVRLECPAYMYFIVEVEAYTSGYSLDTSSISSDAYALHN